MHTDCHETPTRPRSLPPWHLALLCFEWCCAKKSDTYQLVELAVKGGILTCCFVAAVLYIVL